MKAFSCGALVDGIADEPLHDAVVVSNDGVIETVGTREEVSVPTEAERIDCSDAVVVPGLIEAHLHLHGIRDLGDLDRLQAHLAAAGVRAGRDLETLLENGFTTIRDMGSQTGIGLKRVVEEGEIPGPRVFTSGLRFCQTGGHGDIHYLPHEWVSGDDYTYTYTEVVDGPDDCRVAARKRLREGADFIKILTTGGVVSKEDDPVHAHYTDEEIRAFTEEAERWGVPTSAHAQSPEGIQAALRNGVDTIDHGFVMDDETVEMLLERDATLVPTMTLLKKLVEEGPEYGLADYAVTKAERVRDTHVESVRRAYDAGVPIALGTDLGGNGLLPHGDNRLELELYVDEVGMDEMDAIKAGTSNAARTLPVDDVGAVETGRRTDLLVLREDPLDSITNLGEIRAVYQDGERVVAG